tara:strand:- start:214 stop:504 length:291 start_codon:yes stop_codon:yes gene_type:complete
MRGCSERKKDMEQFDVARFPQKFSLGDLVEIVPAPPRYSNSHPRKWYDATGVLATVVSDMMYDGHNWGGRYTVVYLSGGWSGVSGDIYGDFLKPYR